jgi:hypothetical protein
MILFLNKPESTPKGLKFTPIFLFLFPICISCFPVEIIAQTAPDLGSAGSFELFTSVGSVSNTGVSYITGNIGSGIGAITGFGTVNGSTYNNDAVTTQASTDLQNAYNQLNAAIPTAYPGAILGNGQILSGGVYSMAAATSLNGTLTLDGQGDANAVFIFTTGGAFTTSASSQVVLINEAKACNVFWKVEGAASFAAGTSMKGTIIAHNGAISIGTDVHLEGRALSTSGALSTYNTTAYVSHCCVSTIANWTGALNTDWTNGSNWGCGSVPTFTSDVTIPVGALFYPVITTLQALNNITIQYGAALTVSGGTLQIAGLIDNSGTLDVSAGTIKMNGMTLQTIPVNTFNNNSLLNLIISNNVTFSGEINIMGTLSFRSSNITLNTGGYLTLKSTATGTARIADITNGGISSGNVVLGNVTIERYIPAKRAWRLLAAPISSTGAPTINSAWQEGVTVGDPNPGYGMQITGDVNAKGFDQGVNYNPSIKIYNSVGDSFSRLPAATGTKIPISNYPAYFTFVRGSRSTILTQGVNAISSNTTLRIKGMINTGSIPVNINPGSFTLVGNPYPSTIDFHTLTKNNVSDRFYVWDPKIGGSNGKGGYVSLSWNGTSYDATASVSNISQYLASGDAFFVSSLDGINPGMLTIKESDKDTGGSDNVYRTIKQNGTAKFNLLGINADSSTFLLDGVLSTYDEGSSNLVNRDDSRKLYNIQENIAIERNDIMLSIEKRHTIETSETTFLKLYSLKKQDYHLQINMAGLDSSGLFALLKDKYSPAINNSPVKLNGVTDILFRVNADSASFAPDRFSIAFIKLIPHLLNTISLKAYYTQKNIVVEFTTSGEQNISMYLIEVSADGTSFMDAANIAVKANNSSNNTYQWVDVNAVAGMHFYRIKSIALGGKANFSAVVKLSTVNTSVANSIAVYPAIIKGNTVLLQLNSVAKGHYTIDVYNIAGQLIQKCSIEHAGGSSTHSFTIDRYISPGKYELKLSGKSIYLSTNLIKG